MAEQLAGLLPLILILVVFYLLIIRPARKRQRELVSVQQQLSPGVRIMTTSGLYATVRQVTDAQVVLETSPGVHSTWARTAIARIDATGPASAPAQAVDLTDAAGDRATRDGATKKSAIMELGSEAIAEPGADARRTDRPGS